MSKQWTVETDSFLFRKPFPSRGWWRCDRRSKATGRVKQIKLPVEADKPLSVAKRAVRAIARGPQWSDVWGEDELTVDPTIAELSERWLRIQCRDLRPPSQQTLRTAMRVLAEELESMGRRLPRQLTLRDVEELFTTRADKRHWGPGTRIKHLSILKRFLGWCLAHHEVDENVCIGFAKPKSWREYQSQAYTIGVCLSDDQARRVILASMRPPEASQYESWGLARGKGRMAPDYLETAVRLALQAGLRLKNVLRLRWKHLQADLTEMRIPKELMKSGRDFYVPVHPELREHLQRVMVSQTRNRGRTPRPDDYVLGAKIDSLTEAYKSALKRAGLLETTDEYGKTKSVRFHDLRHTFCSRLERFCPHAVVIRLMDHSPRSITGRYTHLSIDDLAATLRLVPRLMPRATVAIAANGDQSSQN